MTLSSSTRREFVRNLGLGAAALPFVLNLPSLGFANQRRRKQRLVVLFSPNGVVPTAYWPDAEGTTPLGLNITTSRCLRRCWLAKPRLGRFRTNGRAAAPIPRSRRNSRRVLLGVTSLLQDALGELTLGCQQGWSVE